MVKRIRDNRGLFFDQIAGLLGHTADEDFPEQFAGFITGWVPAFSVLLMEFRADSQPRVIHSEGAAEYDAELEKYLGGLYLLDPIYDMYRSCETRGVVHVSAEQLETQERMRVYSSYFRHLGASNEVGSLHQISPDVCVHLSILIEDDHQDQTERVIAIMTDMEKLTTSMFAQHYAGLTMTAEPDLTDRRTLHLQVSETLERFGCDRLTERETEVAQCLLRGHSAKSMARLLDLSPGTISIHRSNVYRKMNVGSQAELSSLFLEQLLGSSSTVSARA